MVEVLFWAIIIVMFILSFVGLLYPVIPSVLLLWVGFLLYHFGMNGDALGWVFWSAMIVFTVILIVADIIANSFFVKKFGGSKWGERLAGVAVIVGSFIYPPFGILVVPFVTVLIVEMVQKRTVEEAFKASIGSLIGFLSGSFAKAFIQLVMIAAFVIGIIF
ncbi:DUF456 domain-containing protein [Lentibacillus saliphilus]|uniref:DUF456 domain-containing protein n=1 Tax=Lentibacillus saliphilus TaxID=2737028 RepID=UPI001C310C5C|nr:DUF456 domain-containing protein [Lentibacillus saliphilus]